jgi:hypothetical protein
MLNAINHVIWFKVCRPIRRRYNLSVNCSLTLLGLYVYSKFINQTFTRRQIINFVTFYSKPKMNSYFTVLLSHGYILQSGLKLSHPVYCISPIGFNVIQELNTSYQEQFNKFIDQYNITL